MELSKYEIEVLNLMLDNKFNKEEINSILNSPITGYDYTGAGYFLEITNDILPNDRKTITEPTLLGRENNLNVGFLILIENSKLVLECHSWGIENLPETIRKKSVEIIELKQGILKLNGVYKIENIENIHIVELEAQAEINDLEVSQITQVVSGEERLNWQSPYDEKFVNSTNELIGDWKDIPSSIKPGEKIIFFFHELDLEKPIKTQYGNLDISGTTETPEWITKLMKYEEP